MATDQPTEQVDAALDSVLKASGSALRHYTYPPTLAAMREAMRQALSAACGECGKDGRKQGATEFMRVTERLLSLIEESPEVLARVESAMRQAEGEMAEELRAAVVDRDFLNRRYTL